MFKENRKAESIKEYYIAYFDLLGYKKFFESNPDKVENFLKNIHEAIHNTKAYIQGVHSSPIVGGLVNNPIVMRVVEWRSKFYKSRIFINKP